MYLIVLSVKEISSTIFKVFGMTRPGIEPRSPGPLVNTLPTWPMSQYCLVILMVNSKFSNDPFRLVFDFLNFSLFLSLVVMVLSCMNFLKMNQQYFLLTSIFHLNVSFIQTIILQPSIKKNKKYFPMKIN